MSSTTEARRLCLQEELDAGKTGAERNRLGQFATPSALARSLVDLSVHLLPTGEPIRFVDPAFGTGSFYSALLDSVPASRVEASLGFELDPHYGVPARRLWRDTGLELRLEDFTRAIPGASRLPNLVVCNPPYVRHHHLASADKQRMQMQARTRLGIQVSGLAGLYVHFVLLAHDWMADQGVACWLVPSEFMDVGYGAALKKYLLGHVELLRVHRFDPETVQFDDALVSSCVLWFRRCRPRPDQLVRTTFGGTVERPEIVQPVSLAELASGRKWTRLSRQEPQGSRHATLGDFFFIKRGIATGANGAFILTRQKAEGLGLPAEFLRPILPSPRYLAQDEVAGDSHGLPQCEPQLFLLDCRLPEPEVRHNYPSLWRYLESIRSAVAGRYLCRRRRPWYSQENREPAPFLCTYMARSAGNGGRPFRFILNQSQATAANVYLLLYPRPLVASAIQARQGLATRIWRALNGLTFDALRDQGRVYGGGLYKLEPRELSSVPADGLLDLLPQPERTRARAADLFDAVLAHEKPERKYSARGAGARARRAKPRKSRSLRSARKSRTGRARAGHSV